MTRNPEKAVWIPACARMMHKTMRIAFFELEGWEKSGIETALAGHDLFLTGNKITGMELPERRDFEAISVFVNSKIDAVVIEALPDLKYISTRSTGYDHIDLVECKKRGIAVTFVPGYGDNTVAEFTFGLLTNLTRKIYQGIDQIKETGSFNLSGLRGVDLAGKTLGVIGTGRIGKKMIKISKGFEMNVIAYDPFPDEKFASELGYRYVSLEELLKNSDVITLHCLYNQQTHHMLNKDNIGLIKKGAYLVNTARGGLVETAALMSALEQGILAGAAMDVLEEEGETKDELTLIGKNHPNEEELKTVLMNHKMMRMPNVLITPHNAFNSQEALMRILNMSLESVSGFTNNEIKHPVPELK